VFFTFPASSWVPEWRVGTDDKKIRACGKTLMSVAGWKNGDIASL
jgi:hypothetical protein